MAFDNWTVLDIKAVFLFVIDCDSAVILPLAEFSGVSGLVCPGNDGFESIDGKKGERIDEGALTTSKI